MGQATRRKQRFLSQHPVCAFCGGERAATTVEHCPPRALFLNRQWPEGFEFPACASCNGGSSDADLVVAWLARMVPSRDDDPDGKTTGLIQALASQRPGLLAGILPTASEARRFNRELGVTPQPGRTHSETGVVRVTDEISNAVAAFGVKLTKAVYYKHQNRIFPATGTIRLKWFSNEELVRHGRFMTLERLEHIAGQAMSVRRSGASLEDQFQCVWAFSEQADVFLLRALFSGVFGFVSFGASSESGVSLIARSLAEHRSQQEQSLVT